MKMKFLVSLALLAAVYACSAFAEESQITVAADSSSGTYAKLFAELIGVCNSDEFSIVQAKGVTGGAPGNLDALVNNHAQAAFLHSDVYLANAQSDSTYAKYQTLIALWPEPIHVIALRESRSPKLATFDFGKQQFASLGDAKGFKVGAAGGGVYTARFLTGQGEGGFSVIQFDSGDQVLAGLKAGSVDLAIFVGAAPLPNVEKLDRSVFKIIPVGELVSSRVRGLYRDATINYNGLTNGPIKTLAPLATLLTRKYSTPAKMNAQRYLRECFAAHLDELKDNGSPNWQSVEAADHGVLPWYDLPAATASKK